MASRFTNTNTRAAVLIGASGALGGTELVTPLSQLQQARSWRPQALLSPARAR